VLICSYGTLRSDIEQLNIIPWDVAVVDESQNIKNVQAQITRAAVQLNAKARVALSGTPIMNNTFDLYAQLNFLLPGMFGGQEFFRKEYANPIDRDGDKEKIKALQQMTAPFVLRRTKEQVATDLPEKTESILWCEMGADQMEVYNKVKHQIRDSIFLDIKTGGFEKNKLNILQGILKLRQVCGSPQLLAENKDCEDAVKIDVLMEELQNLKQNKTLVFSQFKGMLHLIAAQCKALNISYFHFDGDTPIAERQAMVSRFQESDDTTRVFLISLKSGNAGLNLTAADYVFLVDPWWNTAVQQQAIDRTHRIGQTKSVFAYKMICKDTIEERIIELQQKKKTLSEELISAEEGFVKNLSEEDVAYLFG
jgi:SNF2 family DNA or RNA helicase